MKLIKPSFEIIEQEVPYKKLDDSIISYRAKLLEATYKQIELAGRICYKSDNLITENSAKPFVDRLIKSGHYAMLEHGTIYLKIPTNKGLFYSWDDYSNHRLLIDHDGNEWYLVTTNLRVIIEYHREDDLQYICAPTKNHYKRYTVKFICDIGVQREFCRHRKFSMANESTRFCNYSKDKFNNELTFIEPCWKMTDNELNILKSIIKSSENSYLELIKEGWKPEQARSVLPLSLKTELIMTGFEEDWKHFFELRALGTTGKPHPQAKELAVPLMQEFINKGYYKTE